MRYRRNLHNVLSAAVLADLAAQLAEIATIRPAGVVIRSAKATGFIAGADIKEFLKIRTPEEGYELVRAGQAVLQTRSPICPARPLLPARPSRWAAVWNSRSPAPIGWLQMTPRCPGIARGTSRHSIRDLAERCAAYSSSVCARPGSMLKGKTIQGFARTRGGLIDELVPPTELLERAKSRLLHAPTQATAPFVEKLLNLSPARPFIRTSGRFGIEAKRAARPLSAPLRHPRSVAAICAAGAESYAAEARSIQRAHVQSNRATSCACSCCRIASRAWAANQRPNFATYMSSVPA